MSCSCGSRQGGEGEAFVLVSASRLGIRKKAEVVVGKDLEELLCKKD